MTQTEVQALVDSNLGFREQVRSNLSTLEVIVIDGEYYSFDDVAEYYEDLNS